MAIHTSIKTVLVLSVLSTIPLSLGACSPVAAPDERAVDSGGHSVEGFSPQDLMFADMMIPHHEQAVTMGNLALDISEDPAIRDLAQRIVDGQDSEILQMEDWGIGSAEGSQSTPMDHEAMGHDMSGGMGMMSGMVSEAAMEELSSLSSPAFDRLFLELMIAHHEGALAMVMMIDDSANAEARELARAITEAQEQEIRDMKVLLAALVE